MDSSAIPHSHARSHCGDCVKILVARVRAEHAQRVGDVERQDGRGGGDPGWDLACA